MQSFFHGYQSQQLFRRLILRILLHQLPAHRQVQDRLAQLLDLGRGGGEEGQHLQGKAGVLAEGFGIFGRLVEALQRGGHQALAALLPLLPGGLQLVAEGHQFVHLGDDAVLFGEGWEGNR